MYRYIIVFVMKRNKKLLAFVIFSFFSTKSFANEGETMEKVVGKDDDFFNNLESELEEIDKQGSPSYSSGIFFSLPTNIGFNVIFQNSKEKNVEQGFFGSRNLNGSLFVNFPIHMPHIYISAGVEVGKNSLFWDGHKKFQKIKIFSDKEKEQFFEEIYDDAIDSTKISLWQTGICVKLTFFFDKFDPRDGFNLSLRGGTGLQFCGSYETTRKESFNGVNLSVSGNDDLIGFNRFYAFGGLEIGYQRMAIFGKWYFTPFFDSTKVSETETDKGIFCFGFSFDLL